MIYLYVDIIIYVNAVFSKKSMRHILIFPIQNIYHFIGITTMTSCENYYFIKLRHFFQKLYCIRSHTNPCLFNLNKYKIYSFMNIFIHLFINQYKLYFIYLHYFSFGKLYIYDMITVSDHLCIAMY